MEGFTKIPNEVFELGLNPNEFNVLCNLIRVQSYREYKGEIKDGWFAKSKNELVKECGLGSHNRLNRILQGMSKMNIVQIEPTNTVTYFKIDMSKMDIVQNGHMSKMDIDTTSKMDVPDMSKIDTVGMSKMDTLHKNSNKNTEQDIKQDNTRDTINNPDNFNQDKEVNKENLDIEEKEEIKETNIDNKKHLLSERTNDTQIPVFEKRIKKMDEMIKNVKLEEIVGDLEEGNTELRIPTREELLCIVYKENISFSKKDFGDIYSGHCSTIGYYLPNLKKDLVFAVASKLSSIVGKYGFKVRSEESVYQNMICGYLEKNMDYFKIRIPSK